MQAIRSLFSNVSLPSHDEDDDQDDHSGRLISLHGFVINICKLGDGALKLSESFIKTIGGVALMILMLPSVAITYCLKGDTFQNLRANYGDIASKTREGLDELCDQIITMLGCLLSAVGNGIGIILPEVGRAARTQDFSRIIAPLPDVEPGPTMKTFFQRWSSSTYKEDETDHTGRLICLVDFTSQLYRFVETIGELAWEVLKGFGALIVAIYMLPITAVTCCFKNEHVVIWRGFHYKVVEYMGSSFIAVPCHLFSFLFSVVPKLIVKAGGNLMGILIPEVGRFVRTHESLKIPPSDYTITTDPVLNHLNNLFRTEPVNDDVEDQPDPEAADGAKT